MVNESELIRRTEDACEQLTRYDGYVLSIEFVELLEKLSDINADCWHCRLSKKSFDEAKELLDRIANDLEFL